MTKGKYGFARDVNNNKKRVEHARFLAEQERRQREGFTRKRRPWKPNADQ